MMTDVVFEATDRISAKLVVSVRDSIRNESSPEELSAQESETEELDTPVEPILEGAPGLVSGGLSHSQTLESGVPSQHLQPHTPP